MRLLVLHIAVYDNYVLYRQYLTPLPPTVGDDQHNPVQCLHSVTDIKERNENAGTARPSLVGSDIDKPGLVSILLASHVISSLAFSCNVESWCTC